MRFTDLFLIVPDIAILALALAYFGQGNITIILVLAGIFWMGIARVMRGQVLSLKEKEYVEAARAAGASPFRIITRHIIPNTIGTIMVDATLAVAAAIITESTLSFLGFGVQPPEHVVGEDALRRRGLRRDRQGVPPVLPRARDLHHRARGELPRRRARATRSTRSRDDVSDDRVRMSRCSRSSTSRSSSPPTTACSTRSTTSRSR